MKRIFCALALVLICVCGWVTVIYSHNDKGIEFDDLVQEAQGYYEKKIYDEALTNYRLALEIKPKSKDVLFGMAETYFQLKEYDKTVLYCEKVLALEKGNAKSALLAAKAYEKMGELKNAAKILDGVEGDKSAAEFLKKLKSSYTLKYFPEIEEADEWFSISEKTMCRVSSKNKYTFYDEKGKECMKISQTELGIAGSGGENLFPAVNDGKWCFVDETGSRRLVPDKDYDYLGPFRNGFAVAKSGDTYGYVDKEFNEYAFEFTYAGNFNNGKASVKKDGTVKIINTSFNVIGETTYEYVVSNAYGDTIFEDKIIGKSGSVCAICDISSTPHELFKSDYICYPSATCEPLAFRSGDRWGYVSKSGKVVINPEFYGAKSFSNGLGAVKMESKWGYVDTGGETIIEENFDFAGNVSKEGTAWVSNNAGFALMSISVFEKEETK